MVPGALEGKGGLPVWETMKRIALAWSVLAVMATASSAGATPFFTQDPRTLPQGKWRVELHLLTTTSDQSLVDGDEAPLLLLGGRASSFVTEARVRYGATDRLTVFADFPYVRKSLEAPDGGERTNSGLGDIFVLAKWKVHDSRARGTRAAVALATKLPTGEYRHLQPELALGTGQTNWVLVALGEKEQGPNTFYGSASYVMTGGRTDTDTNPGQVVALNGAVEHKLGRSPYNVVGELNWAHQGRSEMAGATLEQSGSTVLNLAAGIQYSPPPKAGRKLVIETEVQLPVREDGFVRALPDYVWYLGGWMVF